MTYDDSRTGITYLLDSADTAEMVRLRNQDRFLIKAMGGPLAPLSSVPEQSRILDLACGPGGWALDTATHYSTSEVVGIDISHMMIDYARVSAQIRKFIECLF